MIDQSLTAWVLAAAVLSGCALDLHQGVPAELLPKPETCGDAVLDVDEGEVCDDGNDESGDGCSANCFSDETCGNWLLDGDEDCDDGNQDEGDSCPSDCVRADGEER